MGAIDNQFIQEMQEECLGEIIAEVGDTFVKEVNSLSYSPQKALSYLNQILHNFKGNSQAVSLKHFSRFFHQVESLIFEIQQKQDLIFENKSNADILEFYLSETANAIESYAKEILADGDSEETMKRKLQNIYHFKGWVEEQTGVTIPFESEDDLTFEIEDFVFPEEEHVEVNSADSNHLFEIDRSVEKGAVPVIESPIDENLQSPQQTKSQVHTNTDIHENSKIVSQPEPNFETAAADENGSAAATKHDSSIPQNQGNDTPSNSTVFSEPTKEEVPPRVLLFSCGSSYMGVNAGEVREILKKQEVTVLAGERSQVKGTIHHGDKFINVIDCFDHLFSESELNYDQRSDFFVILQNGQNEFAVPCEKIFQVIDILPDQFYRIGSQVAGSPIFSYIGRHDDKNILLLDNSYILAA